MPHPINRTSYLQGLRALKLISETDDPSAEIDIYVAGGYMSVTVRSGGLPIEKVRELFREMLSFEEKERIISLLESTSGETES
jgi:hypothetical protein